VGLQNGPLHKSQKDTEKSISHMNPELYSGTLINDLIAFVDKLLALSNQPISSADGAETLAYPGQGSCKPENFFRVRRVSRHGQLPLVRIDSSWRPQFTTALLG
jgi:hypothetical protein